MGVCDSSKGNVKEVNVDPNKPAIELPTSIVHVSKSLCKIEFGNKTATGFLIKLFKEGKEFFCMMTCEHVITREMIKQRKTISFYYDSIDAKAKEIKLDPNKRFIQDFVRLYEIDDNIDINIDITVIEILPEDNIYKEFYLTLNEDYINSYDSLKDQEIAIIQYPKGNLKYSYGKIKKIDKYEITHTANTEYGASGSPIFLVNTIKVVGIHTSGDKKKSENYGYCIGPIYNFFRNFSDNKKIMNNNMYNINIIIKRNQVIKYNVNVINPLENINDIPVNKGPNNQLNKITLLYKIEEDRVRIFGKSFVKNNKKNCYLLIDGRERELCGTLKSNEINKINGILNIILIEKNTITNMGYMFSNSFDEQSSLISLPDISEWNTTNVTNMSGMFSYCKSLKSLPDISKWDTTNVKDMSHMFSYCKSLKSLPDISKWDATNVEYMNSMFNGCKSLKSLPDISKWNTANVKNMNSMFYECSSLKSLPDISKWDTTNVTNMGEMFSYCESLISLPDISKWNTTNVTNMTFMFRDCESLKSLPDISKWNTTNVTSMSWMFSNCSSLKSFPDISKWKLNEELDKQYMFDGCNRRIIPEKFKESDCLIY